MNTPILTDEEINRRIAELCGWTRIDIVPECLSTVAGFKSWIGGKWGFGGTPPRDKEKPEDEQSYEELPNYAGSLDAIALAEATLPEEQRAEYANWFFSNLEPTENHGRALESGEDIMIPSLWQVVTAAARQRALAFLEVMSPNGADSPTEGKARD